MCIGGSSVDAWYTNARDIGDCSGGVEADHVHNFVADVVKSFDSVDWDIHDGVLSRLGLPDSFGMFMLSSELTLGFC